MRLAVWMESGGSLLDVAIVGAKGPALLRKMFETQLLRVGASKRPTRVTVWPSVKKAFADLAFPTLEVRKDEFLRVVVEDQCSFGHLPGGLPVRTG